MANPILLCNNITATYAVITSDQLGEKYESQSGPTDGTTRPIYKSFDVENGGNDRMDEFDNLYNLCTGTNSINPPVLANGMLKSNITVGFNDSYASTSGGGVSQNISMSYPILNTNIGFGPIGNGNPYEIKFVNSSAANGSYQGDLYFAITCEMMFNMSNLENTIGNSTTQKVYAYFAESNSGNSVENIIMLKKAASDSAQYSNDDEIQRIYLNSDRLQIQGLSQDSDIRLCTVNNINNTGNPSQNENWREFTQEQTSQGFINISNTYISGKCVAIYYRNAISTRQAQAPNITGTARAILIYKIGDYNIVPAAIKEISSISFSDLHIMNMHGSIPSTVQFKGIALGLKYNFYTNTNATVGKYNATGVNALSYNILSGIGLVSSMGSRYDTTLKSGSGSNITLYSVSEIYEASRIQSGNLNTTYLSFYNTQGVPAIGFNYGQLLTDHKINVEILKINGNSTTKPFYYIGKSETTDFSDLQDLQPELPGHRTYAGNTHNVNFYFYGILPNSKTSGPDPAEIDVRITIPDDSYHNYIIYTYDKESDDVITRTEGNTTGIVAVLRPSIDTSGSKYFRMPILINEDTRKIMADTTMLGAILPVIQKQETSSGGDIHFLNIGLDNTPAPTGGNFPDDVKNTTLQSPPYSWRFTALGKLSLQKSDIDGFFGYRDDPEERGSSQKNKNKDVTIKGYTVTYGPIIFEPKNSASKAEKLEYTHNYMFNFHFLYFDYKGNKNPRNTDGRRSFRALKLNEFDYLDCGNYQFNSATTPESYNGLRDNLLMTSYSLLCTRTKNTEPKSAAGPYSLFYGMLSQDDDREVLQLERDNIHPAYVPGSYGNEQPGPGDKIKGAPSLSCKLNGNIGVAYKNNVWPFELEFNEQGAPTSVANNTVLRNESNVGFDTLANKNSTGTLSKIPTEQKSYTNSVSNQASNT